MGNVVLGTTSKHKRQENIEKLDYIKIKHFCFKEHHYKSKKSTTEIYGNHIADKKLASRTYKELLQLNDQQRNQCLKMGKPSE